MDKEESTQKTLQLHITEGRLTKLLAKSLDDLPIKLGPQHTTTSRIWQLDDCTADLISRHLSHSYPSNKQQLRNPDVAYQALLLELHDRKMLSDEETIRLANAAALLVAEESTRYKRVGIESPVEIEHASRTVNTYHVMGHNMMAAIFCMIRQILDSTAIDNLDSVPQSNRNNRAQKNNGLVDKPTTGILEFNILARLIHDANPLFGVEVIHTNERNFAPPNGVIMRTVIERFYRDDYEGPVNYKALKKQLAATEYDRLPFKVDFYNVRLVIDESFVKPQQIDSYTYPPPSSLITDDWLSQTIIVEHPLRLTIVKGLNNHIQGKFIYTAPPGIGRVIAYLTHLMSDITLLSFRSQIYNYFESTTDLLPQIDHLVSQKNLCGNTADMRATLGQIATVLTKTKESKPREKHVIHPIEFSNEVLKRARLLQD